MSSIGVCVTARLAVVAALFLFAVSPTIAQTYPQKPIRVVLGFPPGGGTDALTRAITPRLGEALGQPFVIDNRPGASGNIAAEIVAKSAPDGYTLLMPLSTVMTANQSLYRNVGFDPIKDFAPITQLATAQYILVVHPSVPAKNVRELVALAKAYPRKLNYASTGVASPPHLAAELFKSRAGINIEHIAYKGGGPAATAMLSGESHVLFGSVASSLAHVNSGRLRALAVTGLKRSFLAPELPTLAESGFPGFNVAAWGAFLAPAGTPPGIISRLHDETIGVLRVPEIREQINRVGYEPTGTTPEQLAEIIRAESVMWAKVIKDAGIRAE